MRLNKQERNVLFWKYSKEKLSNPNERIESIDKKLKELTDKKKQEKEVRDLDLLFKEHFSKMK